MSESVGGEDDGRDVRPRFCVGGAAHRIAVATDGWLCFGRGRRPVLRARSATRRWLRRLAAIAVVFAIVVSAFVGLVATRPGNESFVAKAADLLRDHHFAGVVNWAEARYYEHQAPPKGGVPDRAIVAPVADVSTLEYRR